MELDLTTIKEEENFIRDNLYNQQYSTHAMNTEPYYNLIEITEDIWTNICIAVMLIKKDDTLYFPNSRMTLRKRISRSWDDIVHMAQNNKIEYYFGDNSDHVFIAGGKALSTLLTVPSSDTDYFTTKEINPSEIKNTCNNFEVTTQVINFDYKKQLIKRLYKIPHEIVHSFDIDCCSVLINKEGKIYGSKRFVYSLINGYNTVDFNYFSPSYEWRLIKYSNRGFSVHIPGVINCSEAESLYTRTEAGACIPDSIWDFADIDDILGGTMLSALLLNAKGVQKILLASSVSTPHVESELEGASNTAMRKIRKLSANQMSDYEETSTSERNAVRGKITINNKIFFIDGTIGYDEQGVPNSYKGIFSLEDKDKPNDDRRSVREFSDELGAKILNIFNSPYRKVAPGEQTTSTFHKIVLDDYNQWFIIDNATLFIDALYTMLYFKRNRSPPDLYDEKAKWFGNDTVNAFVYHFARLELNNRIYDKFNDIEVTQIKIGYNEYLPQSLIYNKVTYPIANGNKKGIYAALLSIAAESSIFTQRELDLLQSLYIKTNDKDNTVPKVDVRH